MVISNFNSNIFAILCIYLSMFEPFSKNNVLFKQEQSIKIKNNLPKIEATRLQLSKKF